MLNAGIDDNWYNYHLKDLIRQFQTIFQWVYHSYIHLAGGSFKQTINDYCIGLSGKKLTHSKWEEIIITSNNPDIDFSVTLNALLLNGTLFLDLRTLVQSGKTNVLRPSLPNEIVSVTRVMLPSPINECFRLEIIDERHMESILEPAHL